MRVLMQPNSRQTSTIRSGQHCRGLAQDHNFSPTATIMPGGSCSSLCVMRGPSQDRWPRGKTGRRATRATRQPFDRHKLCSTCRVIACRVLRSYYPYPADWLGQEPRSEMVLSQPISRKPRTRRYDFTTQQPNPCRSCGSRFKQTDSMWSSDLF